MGAMWKRRSSFPAGGSLWAWGKSGYGQFGNSESYHQPFQIGSDSWAQISAYVHAGGAQNTTYGIRDDGTLWSWGSNLYGQSGMGSLTVYSSPVQIAGSWLQVKAGSGFALGIKNDSTLWGWGYNSNGELALGDTAHRSSPVQILGSWSQACGGLQGAAAIQTDGTLWAWGKNNDGRLGVGNTTNTSSPVQVPGSWVQVWQGGGNLFALRVDGTLWGTGDNSAGQLAQGGGGSYSSPIQVSGSWAAVYPGDFHCGIKTDGTMWVWGWRAHYVKSASNNSSPIQIPGSWLQAAPGWDGNRLYSLKADGTLWVTSSFYGTSDSHSQWVNGSFTQMAVGFAGFAGTKSDHSLWTWANINSVSLGRTYPYDKYSSPVQVDAGTSWRMVATGKQGALALHMDGTLWGWGYDGYAPVAGAFVYRNSPTQISGSWSMIAANSNYYAIKTDSTLWVWGANIYGILGVGDTNPRLSPVQQPGSWSFVTSGNYSTFSIKTDGTLWGCGSNYYGDLGVGNTTAYSSPVQVPGSWVQVAVGNYNMIAIRTDGTLWTCGSDTYGQLGQGGGADQSSPVQVAGSWTFCAATSGYYPTSFGIRTDGTLWGWGSAYYGQLANGNQYADENSPVQISGSWTQVVACGISFVVAIKTDGTAWAWGLDASIGLSAQPVATNYSSPVQIGGSWIQVSPNREFVLGLQP